MSAANDSVPIVTIDGPSSSGKGTISRIVASRVGWHLLDSGALYRLVALGGILKDLDPDDVAEHVAVAERARVAARLEKAGTRVLPSAGNFLMVHVGEAQKRFDALLRRGIIVRPVGNYGLPEHLRVTLGTVEQNDRFLNAWEA